MLNKNVKKGDACDLNAICIRLHRINGQISGIEKMLNEKRDYVDIIQQLVAAREAMDKVATLVLKSEAKGCLKNKKGALAAKELNKIVNTLFKVM